MFGLGMTELLVILAIVLLIFGPKRLKSIGSDLGSAIKGFRSAVTDDDEAKKPQDEAKIIEAEASTEGAQTNKAPHETKV